MELVKSFEAACERLNRSTDLPDVSMWPERLQKHLTALYKLDAILEVNNDGWVPDISDTDQGKYFPWFDIINDEDVAGGFRLSSSDYEFGRSYTRLGSSLACRSGELARWMGKNCAELYKELHS